jgi:hypothetical protein
MPKANSPVIFGPSLPNQPTATLLLVENSEEMSSIWPDLRDQHLPTLFGALQRVNLEVQVELLVLTSSSSDQTPVALAPGGGFDPLCLQFDYRPDNKISVGTIFRGIELLASTFHGQSANRHIIIVAASTPSDEVKPGDTGNQLQDGRSVWHSLAQKMAKTGISCHMVLNPNENMNAFTELFYETVRTFI